VDQELEKYGQAAAFIAVLLRLIYDGPKLNEGLSVVDEATALQTLALVARFAEEAGGESVTADVVQARLHGLAKHTMAASREAAERLARQNGATTCIFFPEIGWVCFHLYQTGAQEHPDQVQLTTKLKRPDLIVS
jgi:hypothetical protein